MHDTFRHNAILAAMLFSILATGIALLRRKRLAVVALAALVAVTMVALHAWQAGQRRPTEPISGVTSPTD
jgi:hypothetical protein